MKTFPMFLQMQGRKVVIAGGGEQAAQKCRLMMKTDAQIEILAPFLDPELADLNASGRIDWINSKISPDNFKETSLVFIATGCPGIDTCLHMLAKAAGATINVVDQPDLCDALTPSIVDRSPVVVAIGTEGTAPVLARQIKTRMEELLEPRLGDLASLAGRLRGQASRFLQPRQRRDLWRWVFNGDVRKMHAAGRERDAAKAIKKAILTGEFGTGTDGQISFLDAGHGKKDLMTLRAVQRLQEADILFVDRSVAPEIVDLARRDAERVAVGNEDGPTMSSIENIPGLLVAAARQGERVVFLGPRASDLASKVVSPHTENPRVYVEVVPSVSSVPASGKNNRSMGAELRAC